MQSPQIPPLLSAGRGGVSSPMIDSSLDHESEAVFFGRRDKDWGGRRVETPVGLIRQHADGDPGPPADGGGVHQVAI